MDDWTLVTLGLELARKAPTLDECTCRESWVLWGGGVCGHCQIERALGALERLRAQHDRGSMRRVGTCPSCGRTTVLVYGGVQEGAGGIPDQTLWTCTSCRSTVSGRRFLPAELEEALSGAPAGLRVV